MLDRGQELRILEPRKIVRPAGHEIRAQAQQVAHHRAKPRGIHTRLALEHIELREMPLELLLHVGTHVAARGDGQDVEQAAHGGAAAPLALHLVVVQRLVVEEVETQEGAHPLVERLLEHQRRDARDRDLLLLGFFDHLAIPRERGGPRKPMRALVAGIRAHLATLSDCARDKYCRCSRATWSRSAAMSPLFWITSSATARRCSRVTCAASMRWASARVVPSRACRR